MSIDYDQDMTLVDEDIRAEQERDAMLEDHERRIDALDNFLNDLKRDWLNINTVLMIKSKSIEELEHKVSILEEIVEREGKGI